jgi:predicted RND superfamily exporter protein
MTHAIDTYEDKLPAETRGYFHTIAGAAFVLLATLGILNDQQIAVFLAVAVAAIDLVLVLLHVRAKWRYALYPLLYAGGGVLVLLGYFNEVEVTAIIGLAVAVLGTQFAAAKTPVVIESQRVTTP